jgi:hypothetical protein
VKIVCSVLRGRRNREISDLPDPSVFEIGFACGVGVGLMVALPARNRVIGGR